MNLVVYVITTRINIFDEDLTKELVQLIADIMFYKTKANVEFSEPKQFRLEKRLYRSKRQFSPKLAELATAAHCPFLTSHCQTAKCEFSYPAITTKNWSACTSIGTNENSSRVNILFIDFSVSITNNLNN